jgi:hypothetical protein
VAVGVKPKQLLKLLLLDRGRLVSKDRIAGDRDSTLRAYERWRGALADGLGVAPTSESTELHLAILSDTRALRPDGRADRLRAQRADPDRDP